LSDGHLHFLVGRLRDVRIILACGVVAGSDLPVDLRLLLRRQGLLEAETHAALVCVYANDAQIVFLTLLDDFFGMGDAAIGELADMDQSLSRRANAPKLTSLVMRPRTIWPTS
jgi:hypothetical protein